MQKNNKSLTLIKKPRMLRSDYKNKVINEKGPEKIQFGVGSSLQRCLVIVASFHEFSETVMKVPTWNDRSSSHSQINLHNSKRGK